MNRVVILGRGGAGKSTLAVRLGERIGLPVIELDKHFWQAGPAAMAREDWARVQRDLAAGERWILDGDLGPYDAPAARLERADTVIVLDFPLVACAWRALRRSRERADFWRWTIAWRRASRPALMEAVTRHAPRANVRIFRTQRAVDRFVDGLA
jgi:adenylate kinase family enzyme